MVRRVAQKNPFEEEDIAQNTTENMAKTEAISM